MKDMSVMDEYYYTIIFIQANQDSHFNTGHYVVVGTVKIHISSVNLKLSKQIKLQNSLNCFD